MSNSFLNLQSEILPGKMKKLLFVLLFMHCLFCLEAQNLKRIDSLTQLALSAGEDTSRVYYLNQIAMIYMESNPQKCDSVANVALSLALKIKDTHGAGKSYFVQGGNLLLQGDYNGALMNFFRSEEAFVKTGDNRSLATVYSNIGNVFWYNQRFDRAIAYQKKALALQKKINDQEGMGITYNNLGVINNNLGKTEEALYNLKESARIKMELKQEKALAATYNNIAGIYSQRGEYEEALAYCMKALNIYETNADLVRVAFMKINIGEIYAGLNDFSKALNYFNEGLQDAIQVKSPSSVRNAYRGIADMYERMGDYKNAYMNRLSYEKLDDSLYNVKQSEQFAEMQTKYETKEKERQIDLLEKENELKEAKVRQTLIISIGASLSALLLVVVIVSVSNIKRQKRSKREMIRKIVETEEKERGHFAEELHDGLGPLLSSINMYIDVISNDKTEAEKKEKLIQDVRVLIQDAIASTRVIANKLTPATLKDFGICQAIDAFCRKANPREDLKIHIDDKTARARYHIIIETTIYRVALEMINNTLKYAEAGNISICLEEIHGSLHFSYSDDGKGYDSAQMWQRADKGHGLSNMRNRALSVNGNCEIRSVPGSGFSAVMTIPLKYLKTRQEAN
jgi:signal transduction histidine kinase